MLPGRELINQIEQEQTLSDLDSDEWELSGKLEGPVLEHGDFFWMNGGKLNEIIQKKTPGSS